MPVVVRGHVEVEVADHASQLFPGLQPTLCLALAHILGHEPATALCIFDCSRGAHAASPGNLLIAQKVAEGRLAKWPRKTGLAVKTGYGRENGFGRENAKNTANKFTIRNGSRGT